MNPESVKEIIDYIVKTGELYGTQIYEIAYKQTLYVFYSNFLWIIFFIVLLYLGRIIFIEKYKYDKINSYIPKNNLIYYIVDTDEVFFIFVFIYAALSLLFFIASIIAIDSNINFLINPEWMVIKTILQSVTGN